MLRLSLDIVFSRYVIIQATFWAATFRICWNKALPFHPGNMPFVLVFLSICRHILLCALAPYWQLQSKKEDQLGIVIHAPLEAEVVMPPWSLAPLQTFCLNSWQIENILLQLFASQCLLLIGCIAMQVLFIGSYPTSSLNLSLILVYLVFTTVIKFLLGKRSRDNVFSLALFMAEEAPLWVPMDTVLVVSYLLHENLEM